MFTRPGGAAADGRTFVIPDDIKAMAQPVVAHRFSRTPEAAMQGVAPAEVVADVLRHVPVPSGSVDRAGR